MVNATSSHTKSGWLGWKVLSLLSRYQGTLVALAGLIAIAASLDVAVPFFTQRLIDRIIRTLQGGLPAHAAAASFQTLLFSGAGIFAATASTRMLRSFYNYRLLYTASQCEDQVKNAAFVNFLKQDTAYQGSVNTGEVVGALDRGGTAIYVVLYEILGQNLVPSLLIVVGVLTALMLKNPWMALIVSLPLPAYTIAIGRLSKRLQNHENEVSTAFETVTKESYDIASNVRAVKKFVQEDQEGKRQKGLLKIARSKHYEGERMWAVLENAQTFIATAGRVAVLVFGGYLVLTHQCTVGDYVLFIAMQDMVYGPISQISIIVPKLRRNLSRAERLFEILEQRPAITDISAPKKLSGAGAAIELENVTFCYPGSDRPTLRNVNLTIPANSRVALVGSSGSGKSTLMNLLQRFYDPQEGSIRIGGMDLRHISAESLRAQISVVPQEVELFSRTLHENISYGTEGATAEQVEEAARLAQAHDFIQRLDKGYESQAGERGLKLSGGERQRIGIARAILRDPKILILDEATSHLDNESERLIQIAMEELLQGRTSFVIAHRLSTVKQADLVIVFNEHGIEAVGTHQELWRTSPTYCKLHGVHPIEAAQKRAA
jgi:ABC-type multidrug transport system fused ATPase/permease subunit